MAAPYQVVQQVFDNAVATATNLANQSTAQIAGITNTLSGLSLPGQVTIPTFTPPTFSAPVITPLTVPTYAIPATSLIGDTFAADYAAKLSDAQAAITANLSSFFATYFPMNLVDTELTLAQGWVINVLSNGGAMNPTIENQYWQRDRDRIAHETSTLTAEVTTNWAARGFALPPGAAVGAVLAAQRAGLEQLSQSSREVAIKKYETEVLLQQEAIKLAISLRQVAMTSMVDFIKTIVFAPRDSAQQYGDVSQRATKAANDALTQYFTATVNGNISLIDAQTRVAVASTSDQLQAAGLALNATVQTADITLKGQLGTAELNVRQNEMTGRFSLDIAGKRIEAALGAAQMAATMASAALNGIHATAQVSGSSSDNTQFYG